MELQEKVTAYIHYDDDEQLDRIIDHLEKNGFDWSEQNGWLTVDVNAPNGGWDALKECLEELESEE